MLLLFPFLFVLYSRDLTCFPVTIFQPDIGDQNRAVVTFDLSIQGAGNVDAIVPYFLSLQTSTPPVVGDNVDISNNTDENWFFPPAQFYADGTRLHCGCEGRMLSDIVITSATPNAVRYFLAGFTLRSVDTSDVELYASCNVRVHSQEYTFFQPAK